MGEERLPNEQRQRDCPLDRRASFGEGEQLSGQVLRAKRRPFRICEEARKTASSSRIPCGAIFLVTEMEPAQGNVADNRGKEVVEVMSNPSREDPQGLQLLHLEQLVLHLLTIREVAADGDGVRCFIERAGEQSGGVFKGDPLLVLRDEGQLDRGWAFAQ